MNTTETEGVTCASCDYLRPGRREDAPPYHLDPIGFCARNPPSGAGPFWPNAGFSCGEHQHFATLRIRRRALAEHAIATEIELARIGCVKVTA